MVNVKQNCREKRKKGLAMNCLIKFDMCESFYAVLLAGLSEKWANIVGKTTFHPT